MNTANNNIAKNWGAPGELAEDPRLLVNTAAITDQLAGTPWRRLNLSIDRDVWCLVDADDYDWIIAHNWNISWHRNTPWKYYAKRNEGAARSTIYLHREIMKRVDPDAFDIDALHADHKNGQSLDNRRANLRWLSADANRRHITRRVNIPSLETIVRQLLAGHVAQQVPF